ncbi:hypothetical protein [Cellulomonas xiejunii]|uniref:DUF3995 domain-containing protein n=1 Tax=Cellulomonas xiejunii TaxID=2968083 RepID=A0ABY5KR33_9CELL|nr:hypothetical protein [Cellulomonas xiejunii]MCC2322853.1 hypothetical protein [Cellulomonas xiejunii]UUI72875.1 hypothetical protein NP048_05360 [Cellulomonas xiejunii]
MSVWQLVGWVLATPGFVLVAGVAFFYGKGATGYQWGAWRLPIAAGSAVIGFTGLVALIVLILSGRDLTDGWITHPLTLALLGVIALVIGGGVIRFGHSYGNWVVERVSARALHHIGPFPSVLSRAVFPAALVVSGVVMLETALVL